MERRFTVDSSSISIDDLFSAMPVAMALIDRDGRHVALNDALASLSGLSARQLIGIRVADLSPESGENIKNDFRSFDAGRPVPDHELRIGERDYHVSVKPLRDASGFAVALMVAITDISGHKETERELARANKLLEAYALRDHLTGLGNRRSFEAALNREMGRCLRDGGPLSLIMLDVDNFKLFNDSYGHVCGDECLRAVSRALKTTLGRPCDEAFRYGGEEFAVILPGTDAAGAWHVAEAIRRAVQGLGLPHCASSHGVVTVSLGVCAAERVPRGGETLRRALVQGADKALYRAKTEGRNSVRRLGLGEELAARAV